MFILFINIPSLRQTQSFGESLPIFFNEDLGKLFFTLNEPNAIYRNLHFFKHLTHIQKINVKINIMSLQFLKHLIKRK